MQNVIYGAETWVIGPKEQTVCHRGRFCQTIPGKWRRRKLSQSIYGTSKSRRFLASFTIALHLFLPSISLWNSLIVSSHCALGPSNSRGLSRGLLPLDVLFMTWKTRLSFSRRRTCLSQRILLLLDRTIISGSLYLYPSYVFFKILHGFFLLGQKYFSIFFSYVYSAFIHFFNKIKFMKSTGGLAKW